MVLADTPIWYLALRRRAADLSQKEIELKNAFSELIREGRSQMIGPIRQEIFPACERKHSSKAWPNTSADSTTRN